MQPVAARHALQLCAGRGAPLLSRHLPVAAAAAPMIAVQRRRSSFIKQVMEQVKKDMENDPKLKKDWDRVQQSSQRMAERGAGVEERLSGLGEQIKSISSKTSEVLSRARSSIVDGTSSASRRLHEATEANEALKKARDIMKARAETGAAGSRAALGRTREMFAGVMDTSSKLFDYMGDEHRKAERTKRWREERSAMSATAADAQAPPPGEEAHAGEAGATGSRAAAAEPESALVVSEPRTSSWDRFGAGLRDMPFLSSVFDNPVFDRLFGESEIAASIREMKEVDYNFRLDEFAEDMEYLVAPHIIRTYLEGDQKALEKHCGEAAYAAVNASIKARIQQKLTLDPAVLAGPRELQLVSAKLNDKGPPSFIWTFQMQQVNCLRDAKGEIVEGAIDDIRMVCYAMAVNRHPGVDKQLDLEYPWQVSELAILWNQPCF